MDTCADPFTNDLELVFGALDQALQAALDARRSSHIRFAVELPDERWQADFTHRWLERPLPPRRERNVSGQT